MKNIKLALWSSLALLSIGWWITDGADFLALENFFAWRNVLNQYTGVIAIGAMSIALIIATRVPFIERRLAGLDKVYRLHKWLGITALSVSIVHWALAKGPHWLIDLGLMERRARGPRPPMQQAQEGIRQWLSSQHGLAEQVGEWAFYIAAALMILALIKRFPYRTFLQTHRLIALAYLALVYHAIILVKFNYWSGPIGILLAVLLLGGTISAVMLFFRRTLGAPRCTGKISQVIEHPEQQTAELEVAVDARWPGHAAGQFAFLTLDRKEGPHPFTIASAWQPGAPLRFLIKGLGDYTNGLTQRVKTGDAVTIEGPYGAFTFDDPAPRQIWVSGGIGITPFLARLQAISAAAQGKTVDLFHCTTDYDEAFIAELENAAADAKVNLHLMWEKRDGRLDFESIKQVVPQWREASFWFCGPSGFGQALRNALAQSGSDLRFHQEMFEMR